MTDIALPYPVPDDLDDPRFRWMFDYWCARTTADRLPGRADIDPTDFPHLLGRVLLLDVVRSDEGTLRYRVRLWGSKIRRIFDKDDTGRWLDETLMPGTAEAVMAAMGTAVESRRPHFWRRPMVNANREIASTRRMLLPLASDGKTVDMLLGLIIEDLNMERFAVPLDRRSGVA